MPSAGDLTEAFSQAAKIPPDLDALYNEVTSRALDGKGNERQVSKLKDAIAAIDKMVTRWDLYKKSQEPVE
jgi:hypothetical protein